MAAAAVMSTGVGGDLESCRTEVLSFLRMLSWRIASVEVKRWTAEGRLHAVRRWEKVTNDLEGLRKWEKVTSDLESLTEEIAEFIAGSEIRTGATVLVRRKVG